MVQARAVSALGGVGGQQGQLWWRRALSLRSTEDPGQAKTRLHAEGD